MRSLPPSRRQVLGSVLASSGLSSLIDPPFGFCGRRRSYAGLPDAFLSALPGDLENGEGRLLFATNAGMFDSTTSQWNSCTRTRNTLAVFHDGGSVSSLFAPTLKRTGNI